MSTDLSASRVRILGLDPGSRHTGFGLVEQIGGRLRMVRCGRFSLPPKLDLANRLAALDRQLNSLLKELEPTQAALETPFQGLNPRSLIVLSQARGVLLAVLARRQIPIAEYTPTEVKSAVSGYGRASKSQVGRMVRQILTLGDDKLSEDAADALAVSICCAHRSRLDMLVSR